MNALGKRYVCAVCGSEFLVTKSGDGRLECHGLPMQLRKTQKPSPAKPRQKEVRR